MDGTMTEKEDKLAETARQKEVYEKAMRSLEIRRNRQEMSGLTVMAPFASLGKVNDPNSRTAKRFGFVRFALVLLLGIFLNYVLWTVAFGS